MEFSQVHYDPNTICWGLGNNLVGPRLLARIKLREPTKKEEKAAFKDYKEAERIFTEYCNKGQRFKASGDTVNREITCKITFVNIDKQSISWKQDNIHEMVNYSDIPLKPAAGKFSINGFISMIKSKGIIPIK